MGRHKKSSVQQYRRRSKSLKRLKKKQLQAYSTLSEAADIHVTYLQTKQTQFVSQTTQTDSKQIVSQNQNSLENSIQLLETVSEAAVPKSIKSSSSSNVPTRFSDLA